MDLSRIAAARLAALQGPSWDAVLLGLFLQLLGGLGGGVLLGMVGIHHPIFFTWLAGILVVGFFAVRRIAKMAGFRDTFASGTWRIIAPPADWWRALRLCGWPLLACHAVVLVLWLWIG